MGRAGLTDRVLWAGLAFLFLGAVAILTDAAIGSERLAAAGDGHADAEERVPVRA